MKKLLAALFAMTFAAGVFAADAATVVLQNRAEGGLRGWAPSPAKQEAAQAEA